MRCRVMLGVRDVVGHAPARREVPAADAVEQQASAPGGQAAGISSQRASRARARRSGTASGSSRRAPRPRGRRRRARTRCCSRRRGRGRRAARRLDRRRVERQQPAEAVLARARGAAAREVRTSRCAAKRSARRLAVVEQRVDRRVGPAVGHRRERPLRAAHDQQVVVDERGVDQQPRSPAHIPRRPRTYGTVRSRILMSVHSDQLAHVAGSRSRPSRPAGSAPSRGSASGRSCRA